MAGGPETMTGGEVNFRWSSPAPGTLVRAQQHLGPGTIPQLTYSARASDQSTVEVRFVSAAPDNDLTVNAKVIGYLEIQQMLMPPAATPPYRARRIEFVTP